MAFLPLVVTAWECRVRLSSVGTDCFNVFLVFRVIQAELRGLPLKDVPPIPSYLAGQVKSEEEQMVANRIADIIHSLHAKFDNDPEFQA